MYDTTKKLNPLPPTIGIKDPDVRQFCDALANAWHLRNGQIGYNDNERFITKAEWNGIANNPAIMALTDSGIGGPPGGGGGEAPPVWNGIPGMNSATELLLELLSQPIQRIDINEIINRSEQYNTLFMTQIKDLKNGLTEVYTVIEEGDFVSYTDFYALQAQVTSNTTGLATATADIVQINTVTATSTSASAQTLFGLHAQVNNPTTGLPIATANINAINFVSASSSSASAKAVANLNVQMGSANAGILNEQSARVSSDTATANVVNNIWANMGSGSAALINTGGNVTVGAGTGTATYWTQLQTSNAQIYNSYFIVDKPNEKIQAAWTLRINTDNPQGLHTVAGLGLMVDGTGGTSSFIVEANSFFVYPSGATANSQAPFSVQTGPGNDIYGNPPGAYITDAFIKNASIGTLKVAGNSVTSMSYNQGGFGDGTNSSHPAVDGVIGSYTGAIASAVVNLPAGSTGSVITGTVCLASVSWADKARYGYAGIGLTTAAIDGGATVNLAIGRMRNGVLEATVTQVNVSIIQGWYFSYTVVGYDNANSVNGTLSYVLGLTTTSGGGPQPKSGGGIAWTWPTITVTGGKR